MTTLQTSTSAAAWRPDEFTFAASDAIPEALVLQLSTISGEVDGDAPSVRVAYVDDATAEFTAEAADLHEDQADLSEVLVFTAKVSLLTGISSEQYEQVATAAQLSDSFARAITKRADEAFLAQVAPTPPAVAPAAGLLNISGIVAGDEVSTNLDPLVDLIATLQANGSSPSHIVVDPYGWAGLRKIKQQVDSAQSLLGAGVTDAAQLLLSLPVIVSRSMTEYTGLVVDKAAVVSAVGPVRIDTSTEFYFGSDSVAVRGLFRFGHNVVRPNRLGTFTIHGEGGS